MKKSDVCTQITDGFPVAYSTLLTCKKPMWLSHVTRTNQQQHSFIKTAEAFQH